MEEPSILERRVRSWVLFVCAVAVGGCANPKPAPGVQASAAPSATATIPAVHVVGHMHGGKRVEISEFLHNRLEYHIFADSSVYDSKTHKATFARADGTFFGRQSRDRLRMSAPVAVVDQETKSVTMSGGVHAWTAEGTDLSCDRVLYDDTTQRLHGAGNVRLAKDGNVVTGQRIDADLRLEQYTVLGS